MELIKLVFIFKKSQGMFLFYKNTGFFIKTPVSGLIPTFRNVPSGVAALSTMFFSRKMLKLASTHMYEGVLYKTKGSSQ